MCEITFENRSEFPASKRAAADELTQGQLHIEQRNADKHQHYRVRNEERTAAVTVTQVGKPPDISKSDSVTDNRKLRSIVEDIMYAYGVL